MPSGTCSGTTGSGMPSSNARTSMLPRYVVGCAAATATAASRSGQSITSYPATCSLVSANGPSVTTGAPCGARTVVASDTGRSRAPSSRTPRASISCTQASSASGVAQVGSFGVASWSTAWIIRYFMGTLLGAGRRRRRVVPSPRGRTARRSAGHSPPPDPRQRPPRARDWADPYRRVGLVPISAASVAVLGEAFLAVALLVGAFLAVAFFVALRRRGGRRRLGLRPLVDPLIEHEPGARARRAPGQHPEVPARDDLEPHVPCAGQHRHRRLHRRHRRDAVGGAREDQHRRG